MKREKPQWWVLYALVGVLLALLAIDHALPISAPAHQVIEVAVGAIFFAGIGLWIWASGGSLARRADFDPGEMNVRIYDLSFPRETRAWIAGESATREERTEAAKLRDN